jgi:two-component system, chemotaxis family, protein-glutamate methylesterase/glutaminase
MKKIKVFIIDDSALVRKSIAETLRLTPDIEVVGEANDPLIAMREIPKVNPDVITLDIEMPRMDGITYLRQLQQEKSTIPVIVISSLAQEGSQAAIQALDAGACDVLAKPDGSLSAPTLAGQLAFHIRSVANAKKRPSPQINYNSTNTLKPIPNNPESTDMRLILLGASLGGVEALRYLLPSLPNNLPPILVVQHISAFFSKAIATRLNSLTSYEVREAIHDEPLFPGICLIAPGNHHLSVVQSNGTYRTRLTQTPLVHHCRPAVDVLFRSAAQAAGPHALAILLTGMGVDGALGMQAIKKAGGLTLAEHEDSCVVYGMPRAATDLGVVDRSVPLQHMPQAIMDQLKQLTR